MATQTDSASEEDLRPLTVYYDGGCPLCRREIAMIRAAPGAEKETWIDVSQLSHGYVAPGLTRDAALRRFHVRDRAGNLKSGVAAFQLMWSVHPKMRVIAALLKTRRIQRLLEPVYRFFLMVRRPVLKRFREETE